MKKLAQLSIEEDKIWVKALNFYQDQGEDDELADKHAWADLCVEFPRLLNYDGARP